MFNLTCDNCIITWNISTLLNATFNCDCRQDRTWNGRILPLFFSLSWLLNFDYVKLKHHTKYLRLNLKNDVILCHQKCTYFLIIILWENIPAIVFFSFFLIWFVLFALCFFCPTWNGIYVSHSSGMCFMPELPSRHYPIYSQVFTEVYITVKYLIGFY